MESSASYFHLRGTSHLVCVPVTEHIASAGGLLRLIGIKHRLGRSGVTIVGRMALSMSRLAVLWLVQTDEQVGKIEREIF
jgi:hypothetical protein